MYGQYTLGVEEEFQIVDPVTGDLRARVCELLAAGQEQLGEQLKPEMLQSVVETVTHPCADVAALREEVVRLRRTLAGLLRGSSLALVAAGTHPFSRWHDQPIMEAAHYKMLEENLQDVVRSILIFGLHVHVFVPNRNHLIDLMNEARYFLPHILALSTNSPFWMGRNTGLKSYRTIVWKQFPRTGIPDAYSSWSAFDEHIDFLARVHALDETRRVWWDLRPHPKYGTLEFRICDVPATADETIAIAALFQAIVAKLHKLRLQNLGFRTYDRNLIEENKWRAARYGLDGRLIDLGKGIEVPMRDLARELLDFVDDVVDELGCRSELATVERILQEGTGADRQLAVYRENGGDPQAVAQWLIQETTRGLE
ncbi:MAG: carboxylate-amine ligase [Chloroflexi bacterium]|nr:carboxylate-amine ligase [Chloroflexota bacterium]